MHRSQIRVDGIQFDRLNNMDAEQFYQLGIICGLEVLKLRIGDGLFNLA